MPGFIIDLDGTMYAGTKPIPGSAEFIKSLQSKGLPYFFLTNNSSRRPEEVAAHLEQVCGIPVKAEDIYTSAQAAARYIVDQRKGNKVFPIGEAGLLAALEDAGLDTRSENPDFVVQGIDREFTYDKLQTALTHLLNGSGFILTNPDHQLPTEKGMTPGAGSLGAAIQAASRKEPVVIGKPSSIIMNYAIEKMGLPAEEIWVIGDNLRTDIGGGVAAGCKTALMLSGLVTAHNLEEQIAAHGVRPTTVCGNLMELLPQLIG